MTATGARPIRIGVIGCGVIAYWTYLRIIPSMEGVRLVAASDPSASAREMASGVVRVPVVADSEEIIRDASVDAVVICAPTHLHAGLTVSALEAGKHVLVEKPLATTSADAARVVAAAHSSGCIVMTGFNRRMHPLFEQARQLVADGELGRIQAMQTSFCEPMRPEEMSAWRTQRSTGGGVLLDLATHHIDLARWFLDDEAINVSCHLESNVTEGDTATLSLLMKKGAHVQGFFSYRAARADHVELIGESGTLRVDRHQSSFSLRVSRKLGYGTRRRLVVPDADVARWRVRRLARPSLDPSHRRLISAFVASIRGESTSVGTLDDAVRCLNVVLAAETAVATATRITLEA